MFLSAIEGLIALFFTFSYPSEEKVSLFFGFSGQRIALGIITLSISLLFLLFGWLFSSRNSQSEKRITKINEWILFGDRIYFCAVFLVLSVCFAIWCFVFSWLFIPANLRAQILWAGIIALQSLFVLRKTFHNSFTTGIYRKKYQLFPRFGSLSAGQKKVFWLLVAISVLYILILMPSNLNGTQNMDAFRSYGGDEFVIYPILMDVIKPGETFSATLYHLFIYEDYHYGYPFYAWSTLVLLPVKLFTGAAFPDQIQINLPVLRIFVSVLPVILACFILVYLFTRYKHPLISGAVFLFLLLAPGTLQNNQGFWHPDGLNLLFVCLVLYFLQRDRYRYGRNFYLAAVFTGLSVAIRLYGFFFVLAIGVYLLTGHFRKINTWRATLGKGVFFILIMVVIILFANPFIFRADARGKMLSIMQEKSSEMTAGYEGDYDPRNDYRPGWDAWYPAFEDHYTEMFCFFFLIFSMIFASVWGDQKLSHWMTFCWFIVITGYLVFFVAVKSTQYVLPALLPLMAAIFSFPLALETDQTPVILQQKWVKKSAWVLSGGIFLAQFVINLIKIAPRF